MFTLCCAELLDQCHISACFEFWQRQLLWLHVFRNRRTISSPPPQELMPLSRRSTALPWSFHACTPLVRPTGGRASTRGAHLRPHSSNLWTACRWGRGQWRRRRNRRTDACPATHCPQLCGKKQCSPVAFLCFSSALLVARG